MVVKNRPPHHNKPRIILLTRFLLVSLFDALRPIKKVRAVDPEIHPDKLQIWMVGHATMLINFYGTTILTDPVFGNWLPFPRRIVSAGLTIEQLPKIDIMLISHAHWDHLHIPSIRKLAHEDTTVILSKNCSDLIAGMEFKEVIELENGDICHCRGLEFTTYQPHHWGRRLPWENMKRGYNSYVIEKGDKAIFFCGDSGYGSVFQEVGSAHTIDIAMLPIGAYHPPSFRKVHMDPKDALQAMIDVDAKTMIPFHYGSFRLSKEPMDEPASRLKNLIKDHVADRVPILENGEYYEHSEETV